MGTGGTHWMSVPTSQWRESGLRMSGSLAAFFSLPPPQPGNPVIPLTNWHLINPDELFSNFIIQHQELMRETDPWLEVAAKLREGLALAAGGEALGPTLGNWPWS